jgi:hypothetical protein
MMRRILITLAVCAISSFAFTAVAQASGGLAGGGIAPAQVKPAKAPKAKVYEWCGSESGCGFIFDLYSKTKTWYEENAGFSGTYATGKKGLLVMYWPPEYGCVVELHKIKGTKNYSGNETGPDSCYNQTVEIKRL